MIRWDVIVSIGVNVGMKGGNFFGFIIEAISFNDVTSCFFPLLKFLITHSVLHVGGNAFDFYYKCSHKKLKTLWDQVANYHIMMK